MQSPIRATTSRLSHEKSWTQQRVSHMKAGKRTVCKFCSSSQPRSYITSVHVGDWRESNEYREFHNGDGADVLYTRCCWFHLLDVLRTRTTLPRGWQLLTLPRNFNTSRTGVYWNQAESSMSFARPAGGNHIDMSALRAACRQGRDLVAELAQLGVDWS